MRTLTKEEVELNSNELAEKILTGSVFIYPTDTIYGIGCNALNEKAVDKIRQIKERPNDPFSVIAPSKAWISKNCEITKEAEEWLSRLPGPYTLILKLKNKSAVAGNVNPQGNSLGVRIPKHWFSGFVSELGIPIVTTSANKTGKMFMTNIDDLDSDIKSAVSFAIYEGEKAGRPSKIIHLDTEKVEIKER